MSRFSDVNACWEVWTHSPGALRLASALLHFVWQGAALAAIAALLLAVLRRARPQVKYVALLATLAAMAVSPFVTLAFLSVEVPQSVTDVDPGAKPLQDPGTNGPGLSDEIGESSTPTPAAVSGSSFSLEPSTPTGATAPFVRARRWFEDHRPWIVTAWLLGVFAFSLRLVVGLIAAEWTRRSGVVPVVPSIQEAVARLAAGLRVRRAVRVFQSALAEVPTLVGWLSPVILLPASALSGLTPAQLEAILAHELAHVRRHDYLFNLLQTLVETFLFYHPAVWWVSRRIRQEREHCCDDLAVVVCGDRLAYAHALASLEELRGSPPHWAVAASGASLMQRIRRIVRAEQEPRPGFAVILSSGAVLVVLTFAGFSSRAVETAETPPATVKLSPTAEPKSRETNDGLFRIKLSDGAVIELVGIGEHPVGDDACWRADGSPLAKPLDGEFQKRFSIDPVPNSIVRRFAVDSLIDGAAKVSVSEFQEGLASSSATPTKQVVGEKVREKHRFVAAVRANSRTTVVVNYAGGPWQTVATTFLAGSVVSDDPSDESPRRGRPVPDGITTVWSRPARSIGPQRISAAYDVQNRDVDVRIIAVDKENREHPTDKQFRAFLVAKSPRLPPIKIREFRLQMRAIQKIEFRNVSLDRGQKTNVEVFIDGKRYTPKTADAKPGVPTGK